MPDQTGRERPREGMVRTNCFAAVPASRGDDARSNLDRLARHGESACSPFGIGNFHRAIENNDVDRARSRTSTPNSVPRSVTVAVGVRITKGEGGRGNGGLMIDG